jgi:hypothetical protein
MKPKPEKIAHPFSFAVRLCMMLLLGLGLMWAASAVRAEESPPPAAQPAEEIPAPTPRQLKQAAYNSQWRLQRAIERDGFYSARVALNVWRSNAIDAGLFDPQKYAEFKQQIYEKSAQSNLNCFGNAIEKNNFNDARICLYTWKNHTQELDTFDPDLYEQMHARLEEQKKIQAEIEQNTAQSDSESN